MGDGDRRRDSCQESRAGRALELPSSSTQREVTRYGYDCGGAGRHLMVCREASFGPAFYSELWILRIQPVQVKPSMHLIYAQIEVSFFKGKFRYSRAL